MSHFILMASIIDGKTHLLTLRRVLKGYRLAASPVFDADPQTIDEKCKKVQEIQIAAELPSGNHYWGFFPKVPRRHLEEVVVREAREEYGYVGPVRAVFHDVGEAHQDGTAKRVLSCMVVDNAEVAYLENEVFGRYRQKITRIHSLPAAWAAAIAHAEEPSGDFMVIAVGDRSTCILISSANGDVKVARQIPLGFGEEMDFNDAPRCRSFFSEIAKDIASTNLYYLQQFQGSECTARYMLGNPGLQRALELHGADVQPVKFGFSKPPHTPMDLRQAAAWAHLFGALHCHRDYNLLGRQIQVERSLTRVYRIAMAALVTAILSFGLYLYQVEPVGADKITDCNIKNKQLEDIQLEVVELKHQVAILNQFSGWKTFYRNTYENQPSWNSLFSDAARDLPREIVIDNFRIEPVAGKDIREWNGVFSGHIKVKEWDQGLELLRRFGARLHRSPHFDVQMVRYAPELDKDNRTTEEIGFGFQINAKLTSKEKKE